MCHCIWVWGILRMVKCVSYPQREKSYRWHWSAVLSFFFNLATWRVYWTPFLSSFNLLFPWLFCLEWPHHLVMETRTLGVILSPFLSFRYYIEISKSVASASYLSAATLIQVLLIAIWTVTVIYIGCSVSSPHLLPVHRSSPPGEFAWVVKPILFFPCLLVLSLFLPCLPANLRPFCMASLSLGSS